MSTLSWFLNGALLSLYGRPLKKLQEGMEQGINHSVVTAKPSPSGTVLVNTAAKQTLGNVEFGVLHSKCKTKAKQRRVLSPFYPL